MYPVNQGESSGGPSVQPMKRGRGRPRKDPSLKRVAAARRARRGFEGPRENPPHNAGSTIGVDSMLGQAVTGVIEATFDAGYLLSVRIGNSNTNLRGVVFKPGRYTPVTPENDIAPHAEMIRRSAVRLPAENQSLSPSQGLATRMAATVPAKRKYVRASTAPSVPSVLLPHVNFTNGALSSSKVPSDASHTENLLNFGDKDVHMVEPISMLPPDHSVPAGQFFAQTDSGPLNGGAGTQQGDGGMSMASTDVDTSDSSDASDIEIKNEKEALKSSEEDLGIAATQETQNTNEQFLTNSLSAAPVTETLFNFGSGRMTELLQAVQENMKESPVKISQPISASEGEFQETRADMTDPENTETVA